MLIYVSRFVTPGWLASLIFTVQQYPSVGLAGPLHIGPGHLITEAGGALFSDGETASSGVDKEPNDEVRDSQTMGMVLCMNAS